MSCYATLADYHSKPCRDKASCIHDPLNSSQHENMKQNVAHCEIENYQSYPSGNDAFLKSSGNRDIKGKDPWSKDSVPH